jgi:hypothetical protein
MNNKPVILFLAYAALVLSYAGYKGSVSAVAETLYFNSKSERVYPVPVKKMEDAATLGSSQYYTGADGQKYIDIHPWQVQHFNWTEFFKICTFGFGVLVLISFIMNQIKIVNKSTENQ